jgi:hypothetical protein
VAAWIGGGALVATGVVLLIVSARGRAKTTAWGRFTPAPNGVRAAF